MSMEVILMKTMDNLGEEGSVVKVADGYARNFLFPQKLAEPVTEAARRRLEKLRKEREAQRKAMYASAKELKGKINAVGSVTILAKAIDGENLYGSVGAADIVKALAERDVVVEESAVDLAEPFKTIVEGKDVSLRIHPDVTATIKVYVSEEK